MTRTSDMLRLPQPPVVHKFKPEQLAASSAICRSETLLPLIVERQRKISTEPTGNQLNAQSELPRSWAGPNKRNAGKLTGKRLIARKRTSKAVIRVRHEEACVELSPLDERILILYHSSLKHQRQAKRTNSGLPTESERLLETYGPEAIYAAIKIQNVTRGMLTRLQLAAFHGPKNQHAAAIIQFAFRRALIRYRIKLRLKEKERQMATRIQAWYRGYHARDHALQIFATRINRQISNFQRRFRGLRFWRVVSAALHKRKWDAAREVQRVYRGWRGRCYASDVRFEKIRFAQELQSHAILHAQYARCEGCQTDRCDEKSLLRCFMARYLGLHDLEGAKSLGEQAIVMFPSSALFVFVYGVLLQSICDDLEASIAFLNRAKASGLNSRELDKCEEQFFQAALMLRPKDAAIHLDLAIFFQSRDETDRALLHYEKAFMQAPHDYPLTGYLNRVRMVDRLLLNYHRFCSVFNYRQVNVLVKDIIVSKRGPKVRLCVAKLNHYTIIAPIEQVDACKINAIYLTDEELILLNENGTGVMKVDGSSQIGASENNRGFLRLSEWRSNSSRATVRRSSSSKQIGHTRTTTKHNQPHRVQPVITQLYQDEFLGLYMNPHELSKYSETRSRIRLTKENAEALLKLVKFIDTAVPPAEVNDTHAYKNMDDTLYRVIVIPQILRKRFDRLNDFRRSHASIAIQSVFRGFRFRAEVRRERLLYDIHQRQVDDVLAKLQANFVCREKRRIKATEIQRIVRGVQQRNLLNAWRRSAIQIQRVFRGFLGRKRAIAFREGSFTFCMVDRVFQRGHEVCGRYLMLSIDQCGLSFRLEAYDVENCTSFHGFLSHQSSFALLCYTNWMYAKSFRGQELQLQNNHVRIVDVASIDPITGDCFVCIESIVSKDPPPAPSTEGSHSSSTSEVLLVDCINSINLRNVGSGKTETAVELPLKKEDTKRLVAVIVERLVLVPALPMATRELRSRNGNGLVLTVDPPPAMHYTFKRQIHLRPKQSLLQRRKSNLKKKAVPAFKVPATEVLVPTTFPRPVVFPVVDGLRGSSVGKELFRRKCSRHAASFTRCRCVLPLVSTPAYVESLRLALGPPTLLPYLQITKPLQAKP